MMDLSVLGLTVIASKSLICRIVTDQDIHGVAVVRRRRKIQFKYSNLKQDTGLKGCLQLKRYIWKGFWFY